MRLEQHQVGHQELLQVSSGCDIDVLVQVLAKLIQQSFVNKPNSATSHLNAGELHKPAEIGIGQHRASVKEHLKQGRPAPFPALPLEVGGRAWLVSQSSMSLRRKARALSGLPITQMLPKAAAQELLFGQQA